VTTTPAHPVDHLLWGVPDLGLGVNRFAELAGLAPVPGGSHPGMGTANAIVGAGDGRYLEVIGPDPTQPLGGTLGGLLVDMPVPRLHTWAARSHDAMASALAAREAGLGAEVVEGSRLAPDGSVVRWRNVHLTGHRFGLALPFLIEWGTATRHPATVAPTGCSLLRFEVLHPETLELAHLFAALGIDVEVTHANEPGFAAMLDTPNGLVRLD